VPLTPPPSFPAKTLYRAGLAHAALDANDDAENAPKQALALAPGNSGIAGQARQWSQRRRRFIAWFLAGVWREKVLSLNGPAIGCFALKKNAAVAHNTFLQDFKCARTLCLPGECSHGECLLCLIHSHSKSHYHLGCYFITITAPILRLCVYEKTMPVISHNENSVALRIPFRHQDAYEHFLLNESALLRRPRCSASVAHSSIYMERLPSQPLQQYKHSFGSASIWLVS
jgi:hypothetical protein